ncbi:WXG100 family type VII secretion target [Agreia sp. COWG]|uniref:WXG100 family type VII secretion target n=1 Tax=Agreia sp. COWG TaxID=2773266 RepID=UPI001925383C|nr:WXG100 family type VII secretion target [Agreia sp. COWG]CAD6011403.1 Proteins of 100 residues with WXG [Agreia sp. COWG]
MAVWGLDVDQVRSLGKQLNQQSQQVQTILTSLTAALQSVQWTGPDAENFRSEWSGTHTAALKQVIAALEDASQKAAKNAADQESTSSN